MLTALDDAPTEVHVLRRHRARPAVGMTRLLLLTPVALSLVTGLVAARDRQLWLDEYATWWASTLGRRDFLSLTSHLDTVQAPYYVFLHYWIKEFGESPLSMRTPSIATMVIATWIVVRIGVRMYQPAVGFIAGLLMASVPFMGLYAQTARPYAFAVMFTAAATLVLFRVLETGRNWWWAAYCLTLIGAGAVHLVSLMVLLAHASGLLWAVRREGAPRSLAWKWGCSIIVALVTLSPIVLRGYNQQGQIGGVSKNFNQALFLIVYAFRNDLAAAVVIWMGLVGACLVVATRSRQITLGVWAAFPYALVIPTMGFLNLASLRYLLFALPAWFVLASAGLWRAACMWTSRPARIAGRVCLTLAFMLTIPGNVELRQSPLKGYPDFRAAAAYITAQPGDALAFGGLQYFTYQSVNYNLKRRGQPELTVAFYAREPREAGWYAGITCTKSRECLNRYQRVWLFTTTTQDDPLAEMRPGQAEALRQDFAIVEDHAAEGIKVLLLVRKKS
jgi:mannosyltransferase